MTIDWGTIKVDKEGDEKILEDILPPNYDYKVRLFMIEERSKTNKLTETKFKAKVDTNVCKGLLPYYIISYNKQGSFQMITENYNKGPRVVRKDYVLWKIQNMQ